MPARKYLVMEPDAVLVGQAWTRTLETGLLAIKTLALIALFPTPLVHVIDPSTKLAAPNLQH